MSKIAFVFPGQGTQYVGMGKELYENNELARQEFDNLFSKLDFDLRRGIKRNKKYSTSNCINEFNIKKIIRS